MTTSFVLYHGFHDKTNFTRIPAPRARHPQDSSTIPARSPLGLTNYPGYRHPWGKEGVNTHNSHYVSYLNYLRGRLPGVIRLTTWLLPSSCAPGFTIKRYFSDYWPCRPGTHRTLLQSPHGPVPDICLALPWRTAAGGTRHRSPVPIYPLGLDKTNFPGYRPPWGKVGNNTHNSH